MRWEDERYVRVYTRDTPDWLALGWEAQTLFLLTMRKVDRAGMLDLGKAGPRGLAALVRMPVDVVESALPILLADGCVEMSGATLLFPNFIEAQETPQSDRQRKAESRARARDRARLTSQNVTAPPDSGQRNGQKVTGGHAASQEVTPYCAVPCRAEPNQIEQCGGISRSPDPPPSHQSSLAHGPPSEQESISPQHPPAATATLEPGAGVTEKTSSPSVPAPDPDDSGPATEPTTSLSRTWPGCYGLQAAFAQRMAIPEGQGLVRIARPELVGEMRGLLETEVQRLGLELAVEVCYQQAISQPRKRGVYWLSWFLSRLQDTPSPSEVPQAAALSDCEPWAALLAAARENGAQEVVDHWLRKLEARVEDTMLVLTASDECTFNFVGELHLPWIREKVERLCGLTVRFDGPKAPQVAVGGSL